PLLCPPIAQLGPDALLSLPDPSAFASLLRRRSRAVKAVLLDQAVLSGIGNWLADEVLYQARLHPETPTALLSDAHCTALHSAIHQVVAASVDVDADSDRFPPSWLFHVRWAKKPGSIAGHKLSFITVAGRTSAIVPALQKLPGTGRTRNNGRGKTGRRRRGGGLDGDAGKIEEEGEKEDEEGDEEEEETGEDEGELDSGEDKRGGKKMKSSARKGRVNGVVSDNKSSRRAIGGRTGGGAVDPAAAMEAVGGTGGRAGTRAAQSCMGGSALPKQEEDKAKQGEDGSGNGSGNGNGVGNGDGIESGSERGSEEDVVEELEPGVLHGGAQVPLASVAGLPRAGVQAVREEGGGGRGGGRGRGRGRGRRSGADCESGGMEGTEGEKDPTDFGTRRRSERNRGHMYSGSISANEPAAGDVQAGEGAEPAAAVAAVAKAMAGVVDSRGKRGRRAVVPVSSVLPAAAATSVAAAGEVAAGPSVAEGREEAEALIARGGRSGGVRTSVGTTRVTRQAAKRQCC
ncbi:hypothetical protein CLOP_g25697, partial [Closterium sp. NIES-67]